MTKPLWATAEHVARVDLAAHLTRFRNTARSGAYGPYGWVGGSRLNKSTVDALRVAYFLAGEVDNLEFTQGGLNGGAVSTSAATHDGLDVADTVSKGWSIQRILRVVYWGMRCGMIGFIRGTAEDNIADGMVPHIHWVRVGAEHAHWSAREQIYNLGYGYAVGGAGLAGAPQARWYGPSRQPLVEWDESKYNPRNGWLPSV